MTDQQRQTAIEALETFRANLSNSYGFPYPDYATAPAKPVATVRECHVFRLTPATNGVIGFVLADAVYPLHAPTYKHDLARAVAIAQSWRWVYAERQRKAERNGRKRKR